MTQGCSLSHYDSRFRKDREFTKCDWTTLRSDLKWKLQCVQLIVHAYLHMRHNQQTFHFKHLIYERVTDTPFTPEHCTANLETIAVTSLPAHFATTTTHFIDKTGSLRSNKTLNTSSSLITLTRDKNSTIQLNKQRNLPTPAKCSVVHR